MTEPVMTEQSFVVERAPWGLVIVRGVDATSFLQSLVSQDLDGVRDGEGVHSLLLSPQGKLDVDFRALRVSSDEGDEWWLDCESAYGLRLADSLNRFRIRVKVEIEDRTASSAMASFIGAPADGVSDVPNAHREMAGLRIVTSSWPGVRGFDVLGSAERVGEWVADVHPTVVRGTLEQLEAVRIKAGVPRLGVDTDEKTIPQEALLERDAVSFTKGCFLGQELVCRIDTRGHVNRYLRRLRIAGTTPVPSGAIVSVDDREVGTVTSVTAPDEGAVALGMLRHEVEPPAEVVLRWDGGEATATVEAILARAPQ